MLFSVVREKQSEQKFRIKSARKTIYINCFGWMYMTLIGSSGIEPMSVPNIENTSYFHYVFTQGHKIKH